MSPLRVTKYLSGSKGSGILLIVAVIASLAIANSPAGEKFMHLLEYKLGFSTGIVTLNKSVTHWVNDLLMAVFFLLIGAEVKREIKKGELSSVKKASLPVAAALGGIVVPVLIFLLFNYNNEKTLAGWAVPMATDIAFALSILSLAGNIPHSVRIFLSSLAIADDIGAILVIALFYGDGISLAYLGYAGIVLAGLLVLNLLKVKRLVFYLIPGLVLWYFIYKSGIHATIAGVLLAFMIPIAKHASDSPLEKLEHALHKPVGLFIIPLFAMVNTAIPISFSFTELFTNSGTLGIMAGLVIGKFAGIAGATWVAIKLGASLPSKFTFRHVQGIGFLGGVGFTMSIFIALLAFDDVYMQDLSKVAILIASLISGILGFWLLRNQRERKVIVKHSDRLSN